MRKAVLLGSCVFFLLALAAPSPASEEGTRHITGDNVDLYFMNDKVFGHVHGHPVWAIYHCRKDIQGEIDVNGTYHGFHMIYHKHGDRKITGDFGPHFMAMGDIKKTEDGFIYPIFIKAKAYQFTITYEQMRDGHLVNSIIHGDLGAGKAIRLKVDGRLCPFATTGIIMIAAGAMLFP